MPWKPLPRIAFAVAVYPFQPSSPADLPLELGDELYIIEQGGINGSWYRGYLVAPPSLLAGLTSVKGQTLEARVFSGIFPKSCVEVREVLGDANGRKDKRGGAGGSLPLPNGDSRAHSPSGIPSDVKASRKISQVTVIKLEEDAGSRRSGMSMKSTSIPITPPSAGSRDVNNIVNNTTTTNNTNIAGKPPAPVPMLKIGDETPTSASEPLVDEIASCLREWHSTNIHELLLARQYTTLENMSNIVLELDLARRQFLHNVLTAKEREILREETVWNLVRGNKMLSGEVIVRDPKERGRLLTGDDSAIELTKLQSEMSMLDGKITQPSDIDSLHHLLFELNAVTGAGTDPMLLSINLCFQTAKGDIKPLSESYVLDVPSAESFAALASDSKLKTLFTELTATDIGESSASDSKLFLTIKIMTWESPKPKQSTKSRSNSRDGPSGNKGLPQLNSAGKGSLRGRRSMMWGPKPRGLQQIEPVKENGKPPSRSSDVSDKDRPLNPPVKANPVCRIIGAGALELGPILKSGKAVEQVVTIWSPLGDSDEEDGHSDGFHDIIRSLIYSPTGRYTRSYQAARLHTHLHPFVGPDTETLVRNNPTFLHSVASTRRIGFPGAPTKPRSDIYISLSRANISRDALLSHPVHGQVPAPQGTGLRNLQLTLEVRDASGTRIDNCIYPASNTSPVTAWRTTVVERRSAWNQTIRLNLPADQVPGSHIIMSIADAPEFPFALSWMPLWDQQAFIRDGPHSLLLHAYDKSTSSIENGKGAYLALPWSALGKNESTKDEAVTGPVATLLLETDLCSTEYSQDHVMLGLISWKERPATQLLDILRRLVFVPEIEIVKQLSSVFDALFGIIVEHAGNDEFEDLIFSDLVTVLGIVHDRRFNLGPLVDKYAEEQFNFPFATPCLIRSYSRLLQATPDSQQSRNLRAAFKVGRHILKFIINARVQQKAKEEGIGITNIQSTFNRDLRFIFKSVEALMQNSAPILVGSKTLVVQHFHTWLPELLSALSKEEIISIALSFMEACKDVKGMLVLYKLVLILNYIRLPLFAEPEPRKQLDSHCIKWLAPYWGETTEVTDQYRDQVRLCSSIVAEQIKHPDPELFEYMPKAVASYCAIETDGVDETNWLSLLFSKSFPFQLKQSKHKQKFDETLVELSAVIASLSKIPHPKDLALPQDEMAIFLSQAFNTHSSVLNCVPYPASWLSLRIYHHRTIAKNLEHLSSILIKSFLPPVEDADSFDMELWRLFFSTTLKLVSSDALALETFPEQKRRAVWKIAGDVREIGADLLRVSWKAIGWDTTPEEIEQYGLTKLGGYQVQYVPNLVPQIIELCLSVHEGLRRVAVEILQTMIVSEWQLNEDLAMIEAEIISSLDALFKTKNLTESITQKLFISELMDLFETNTGSPDADLMTALKELVATIDELLDLLVAAHSGNISESLNTLKLMEFMKDMDKEDIFIRYVHELGQGQVASRNFKEAGLALQFHADLYEWDTMKIVPALVNPYFPEQTAFERKELLYFEIIQHLEDGKAWAHAIACYQELAEQYEHTILDFAKLSRTQASMARIYDSIVKDDILIHRYFRVIFKGLGFPPSLRDKQYIFEGTPTDRLASFTERMQKQHPAAQVITSGENEDFEGQFIQISAVSIQRDMNHLVYQRAKVPQSVRDHLLTSVPAQFSITSKRNLSGNDVKKQWIAKTVYTVAEAFPNVLRRSEIIATDEVTLSPIQTAIERTWRKTQELLILEKRASSSPESTQPTIVELLGQLLDIESKMCSCVALYRQFTEIDIDLDKQSLEDDEKRELQPIDPLKGALSAALIDHTLAIKRCLSFLTPSKSYEHTYTELSRRFEAIFAPELSTLIPPAAQPFQREISSFPRSESFGIVYSVGSPPTPHSTSQSPPQTAERDNPSRHGSISANIGTQNSSGTRRLSLNPFKRPTHGHSDSTTTTIATVSKIASPTDATEPKTNGSSAKSPKSTVKSDIDADSVSKSTVSRTGKSETAQKRRSWFGGSNASVSGNQPSPTPAPGPTEDIRTTQRRILERAKAAQKQLNSTPPSEKNASTTTSANTQQQSQGNNVGIKIKPSDRQISKNLNGSTGDVSSGSTSISASASGMRDSVMKRFSLLKAGRKPSRANFRDGNGFGTSGVLKEE